MSQDRLPPPDREVCLVRLRPSSQKGGTILAEDATDRAAHERRLCDPDGYRPAFLARRLWRSWRVVEHALTGAEPPPATRSWRNAIVTAPP